MSSIQEQPAPVLVYGNPSLRRVAKLVPANYSLPVLEAHTKAMWATLASTTVGSAIAAPQIGLDLRIFITRKNISGLPAGIFDNQYYNNLDYVVFINPYFVSASGSVTINNDGCLSIPNYTRGGVTRYANFTLRFQAFELTANGLSLVNKEIANYTVDPATYFGWVAQHEADHLDGKFFVDQFAYDSTLDNYKQGSYNVTYATLPDVKF